MTERFALEGGQSPAIVEPFSNELIELDSVGFGAVRANLTISAVQSDNACPETRCLRYLGRNLHGRAMFAASVRKHQNSIYRFGIC
jgi:hypothetical protein